MNIINSENIAHATQVHRESLRKSLKHRLEVARASGNEKLVHQLEAEANYLRLS
jgi:hypothetical protein